ncbi:MAG: hypothetical protein PHO26_04630 [Dehalococcoidia bacterium]|nr:hypothetical protein [Dehalococcoidia bacterium]MDD5494895.1 hypothetical protein [Dehalococcoidia bacterium]
MNEEQRIKLLEEEFKILKNEVKSILLDIREQYLNIQNPFNANMIPNLGVPPAGANPEQKDKLTDGNPEDLEAQKDDLKAEQFIDAAATAMPAAIPAPKADAEIEAPGFGSMNDLPGAGPSAGPGPGPSAGFGPSEEAAKCEAEAEAEEEPAPKGKGPKGKKKNVVQETQEVELEMDLEEEDEEEADEKTNTRVTSPKNIKDAGSTAAKDNGKKKKEVSALAASGKADLVVIAGMTQWVDQATLRLGKERTETLVEMAYTMGRIPDNLKDVMIRMARISRHESNGQMPAAADYLSLLAQLESLMGGTQVQDNALLSIISMMKESSRG